MELPEQLLTIVQAKGSACLDQAWADIEKRHADIQRISIEGPGEDDAWLIQLIAAIVTLELWLRKTNRLVEMMGEKEIE